MFAHLLVPLDGSRLAEAALPLASTLASKLNARVTLLHLIEERAPSQVHGEHHLRSVDEAEAYLRSVAARSFGPDVTVDVHVHSAGVGDVARGILEHGHESPYDLIVMCAHGRGGLRAWVLGSIAEQVVTAGATPVVLVPAREATTDAAIFACRRILVALDTNVDHARSLGPAIELARACGASLHLITAVPTLGTLPADEAFVGKLLPLTAAALLEQDEEKAARNLQARIEQVRRASIIASGAIYRGDPAVVILDAARQAGADLVALGTHGPAGVDALWEGSVARKVAGRSQLPLLLVPVRESPSPPAILTAEERLR